MEKNCAADFGSDGAGKERAISSLVSFLSLLNETSSTSTPDKYLAAILHQSSTKRDRFIKLELFLSLVVPNQSKIDEVESQDSVEFIKDILRSPI